MPISRARSPSANENSSQDNADGKLGLFPEWEPSWAQRSSAGGAQVGVRGVDPTPNQDSSGALTDRKSGVPEKPSIYSRLRDRESVQAKRGVKRPCEATSPVSNVDSNKHRKLNNSKKCMTAICSWPTVCGESENDLLREFERGCHERFTGLARPKCEWDPANKCLSANQLGPDFSLETIVDGGDPSCKIAENFRD